MLGRHFYNESIRKTIIGFGTLFNNIELRRKDKNNNIVQVMKVPLAYGPREKFLARVNAEPDLEDRKSTQIQLPRISFELTGLTYDSSRKISSTQMCQTVRTGEVNQIFTQYVPVPYNMTFELSIIAKHNDDAVQILEQILPFFQPSFTITLNMISNTNEYKDIPIVLDGDIGIQDDYEADFKIRRTLIYTLKFVAKSYIYGPLTTAEIIKKVNVDIGRQLEDRLVKDSRYTVTPKALTDYNNDGTVITAANINQTDSQITLSAHNFVTGSIVTYRTIGEDSENIGGLESGENYYVIRLDPANFRLAKTKLDSRQGYYIEFTSSGSGEHKFSIINQYDDAFVEADDDYGFNETWTDYNTEEI